MKDSRKIWLNPFQEGSFPNWTCPNCQTGSLRPVDKTFHYWESAASHEAGKSWLIASQIKYDDNSILGMELAKYRYSALLKCNKCSECVSSCGSGEALEDYYPDLNDTVLLNYFSPKYFYPAIDIFPVHEKCPQKIKSQIKESFKLFFADPPAAANYVRKAIDEILTNKKVKRFVINKNKKRVTINLHDRIVAFEKINFGVAQKLFAIKWLGNEGSHTDKITKNDVLDAYEILEFVVDDLYVGYKKSIEKKILKINKTKKPLHPST